MRPEEQLCTDSDVYGFLDNIPETLQDCRQQHRYKFKHQALPLDGAGSVTKVASKVRQIEYIDQCQVCHMQRHHIWVLRTQETTDFWYTNRNPLLDSPRGVRRTGISIRAELRARGDQRSADAVLRKLRSSRRLQAAA
jgi:hypothetical protein